MQGTHVRGKRWSMGSSLGAINLLVVGALAASFATAQTSAPRRSAWDAVYTEVQASRGMTAFGQSCSGCHVLSAVGRGPLVGETFWKSFMQKTVGELLGYVSANMPNGAPGSLSESTYADIAALILKANGFPAGPTELRRANVLDVEIIPRDGGTDLPASALVRVVGCLARSGQDWVVTRATAPERAERTADPSRPLGSRTMVLKFVLTKLDAFLGARVTVTGLLIGSNGADGINVTTVERVAGTCSP
jgi:mono/diheme cytochrome c family protein